MNQTIRHQRALRDMPLSMSRATRKPTAGDLAFRGLTFGAWIAAGGAVGMAIVGLLRAGGVL